MPQTGCLSHEIKSEHTSWLRFVSEKLNEAIVFKRENLVWLLTGSRGRAFLVLCLR